MKITVDNLQQEIMKELQNYQQEVTGMLKDEVQQTAKDCVKEIKRLSPKNTGEYKKGWSLKKMYESNEDIRFVIHNRKYYNLTHLLEHGHAGPGGISKGSAKPIPHISVAERHASEKLFKRVKVVIKA